MSPLRPTAFLALLITAQAQQRVAERDGWCDEDHGWDRDRGFYCEVREMTLPANRTVIAVDAEPNGGIYVEGWDRNEIRLRAKVSAHARTDEDAKALVGDVELITDRFAIRAAGPRPVRRQSWSVSYELLVPRRSNVDLTTLNGGIEITGVAGKIEFRTTNGGVHLSGLAGDVRGQATNGGLHIELDGTQWDGEGMNVETTNGGVRLDIPRDYSARLETGTVNGGLEIDFPITVQGRINRRLTTELGNGGKTIRATTTNGGVVIRRG